MTINQVLNQVLKEISVPKTEETNLKKIANEFIKKIPNAKIGGSLAKGTLVRKKEQDIDVFVSFDSEEDTKKLGGILDRKGFSVKVLHGSRDYFKIKKGANVFLEVVPVVRVGKMQDVENVTDFSLSHVAYVKKKLRGSCSRFGSRSRFSFNDNKSPTYDSLSGLYKNLSKANRSPTHPKLVKRKSPGRFAVSRSLADEIKLAKVFCYAVGCYGAESYISGFSGYALELLVIYFGGFVEFLRGIQRKNYIDIEKSFKSERVARSEINGSKLVGPVLLVDPTYKYRNACAGLNEETFSDFVVVANQFLKSPSKEFFVKKEFDIDEFRRVVKRKKSRLVEFSFKTNRQEGDIAGTKMKKFFRFLVSELERKQQKVVESEFVYPGEGQRARGYVGVRGKPVIDVRGPSVLDKNAIVEFKKVRKKIFKKGGYTWARESVDVEDFFKRAMKVGGEMGVVGFDWSS